MVLAPTLADWKAIASLPSPDWTWLEMLSAAMAWLAARNRIAEAMGVSLNLSMVKPPGLISLSV
ncbi:hypothetical protein D3C80_1797220 [compost metagenome]